MKTFRNITKWFAYYWPIWLVFGFYLIVVWPYFGQTPMNDFLINYHLANVFHEQGVEGLISAVKGGGIHPPLLVMIISTGFYLFGRSPMSYALSGTAIYILTVTSSFILLRRVAGYLWAALLVALIFCHSLVILNFFFLTDDALILGILIIASLALVLNKKVLLAFSLVLLTLVKQTALLLVAVLTIASLLAGQKRGMSWRKRVATIIHRAVILVPAAVSYLIWQLILRSYHGTNWHQNIISSTSGDSFKVLAHIWGTGNIFNQYWVQNIKNLMVLNFQWLLVLLSIVLLIVAVAKGRTASLRKALFVKLMCLNIFLSVLYALLAFSFTTFAIPRYALPLFFSSSLIICYLISSLPTRSGKIIALLVLVMIYLLSNFSPANWLSITRERETVLGLSFYKIDNGISGSDRIDYNRQFLEADRRANEIIKEFAQSSATYLIADCGLLKLNEAVDHAQRYPAYYPQFPLSQGKVCLPLDDLKTGEGGGFDYQGFIVSRANEGKLRQKLASLGVINPTVIVSRLSWDF